MNSENKCSNQEAGKFPIKKPGLTSTDQKFPYRDNRHYTNPSLDFSKKSQLGYTAEHALKQPHQNYYSQCHSPELPTSHPWFEPSN